MEEADQALSLACNTLAVLVPAYSLQTLAPVVQLVMARSCPAGIDKWGYFCRCL